jgi:hypothetical protein
MIQHQEEIFQPSHYIGYKRPMPLLSASEENEVYTTKHFKDFAHGRTVEDSKICAIIAKENVKILSDVAESINVEQNSGFVELCTEDEFTTMMANIARGEMKELNARIQEADRKVEESENTIVLSSRWIFRIKKCKTISWYLKAATRSLLVIFRN